MADRWLVADLGGTNARVGLATRAGLDPAATRLFRNADFDGFPALIQAYLDDLTPGPVTALCAGVAGPVRNGTSRLTNHSWFVDSADLRRTTGADPVVLINDLQAQGYALDNLPTESLTPLFPGATAPRPDSARLVMGLGTGCNVAVVHRHGAGLFVPPAESGHGSLPFCDGRLGKLIAHLGRAHPHRPIEAALSGPGLCNIHRWLGGGDPSPEEIAKAHEAGDATATETLTLFSRLLGRVAGDLCLAHLPMGGLFLIGGTARAVAPHLAYLGFHAAFTAKGPYSDILRDIPIHLIEDDSAALRGCMRCLKQHTGER